MNFELRGLRIKDFEAVAIGYRAGIRSLIVGLLVKREREKRDEREIL